MNYIKTKFSHSKPKIRIKSRTKLKSALPVYTKRYYQQKLLSDKEKCYQTESANAAATGQVENVAGRTLFTSVHEVSRLRGAIKVKSTFPTITREPKYLASHSTTPSKDSPLHKATPSLARSESRAVVPFDNPHLTSPVQSYKREFQIRRIRDKLQPKQKEKGSAAVSALPHLIEHSDGTNGEAARSLPHYPFTEHSPAASGAAAYSPTKPHHVNSVKAERAKSAKIRQSATSSIYRSKGPFRDNQTIWKISDRSVKILKVTAKSSVIAIKVMLDAGAKLIQSIIALLGAGSTFVIISMIIIIVVGLLSSPFGVFFSDDNRDNVMPISDVIAQTNVEFSNYIQRIINNHSYVDSVEYHFFGCAKSTIPNNWVDIITIFAIRTSLSEKDALDVVTIDTKRIQLIKNVFQDMYQLSYWVETIPAIDDEDDDKYILHLEITGFTAQDMITRYNFNSEQESIVYEMLSADYASIFKGLLSGV